MINKILDYILNLFPSNTQFNLFKDKRKEWRFNLKSNNNKILLQSEGYKNKQDAIKTINLIKQCRNSKIVQ